MIAWLVSARVGDRVGGIDIALLAATPPPEGFPSRRVSLGRDDSRAFVASLCERNEEDAALAAHDGLDAAGECLARLRRYREATAGKAQMVRDARAAGLTPALIAREAAIPTSTLNRMLGGA